MTQIVIPEVGESITSGVISAWLKEDGQFVERDEPILELETDKITQELVAPASGILKRRAAAGDEVEIGSVVGEVDESASPPAEKSSAGAAKAAAGGETPSATAMRAMPGVRAHERPNSEPRNGMVTAVAE